MHAHVTACLLNKQRSILVAVSYLHQLVAMGKRADARKEQKGLSVQKDHLKKKDTSELKWVPKFRFFAKESLRSYPDTDGVCVFVRKGEDERKFFRLASILKGRTSQNDELCKRIGMGLALDVATVNHALRVLTKHFGTTLPEEVATQLKKTGVPGLLQALATEKGQAFMAALQTLDVGQTKKPAEKDVKKALKVFREYLEREDKDFHRSVTWLASQSAALYLGAMALLKDMAFFQDPKGWISKVEGKQKDEVRAWQKSPSDKKKMDKALLVEFMKKVQDNEPDKDKKRKASDSSSEAASEAPESKSNSPSSSESGESAEADSGSDSSKSLEESDADKSSKKEKKEKKKDKKTKKQKAKDKKQEKAKKELEKAKKELAKKNKEEEAKKKEDEEKAKEEKKKRKEAKKAPEITLSPEGATSESEEVKEVYAGWAQEERNRFARDVAEAEVAHMAEKKSDKLTLAALVSVIDNLPAEVLKHHNLEKLLTALKGMQKLPKKEKVQDILAALNTIVLACGADAEENEKVEEKQEIPEEQEEKPADAAEAPGADEMPE